jgi:hypothetical protein
MLPVWNGKVQSTEIISVVGNNSEFVFGKCVEIGSCIHKGMLVVLL